MAEAAERMRQNLASQRITPPIVTTPQVAPQNMQPYQPELRETPEIAKHAEPPVAPAYQPPTQAAAHGVYLEPAPVRQTYVAPSAVAETPAPPEVSVASYVPPVAEAPRMPRMPQVEDFPKPVQDQIRQQQRGEAIVQDPRRKSLFERLASFGASRQEETLQIGRAHV